MVKKKIAVIIPSLSKAGAERVASRLSIMFEGDFEFHYILFGNVVDYEHKGKIHILDVNKNKNKIFKMISYIRQVRDYKMKNNIDISISFLEAPNILNILTRTKRSKTIVSIRNYISLEYKNYKNGKILMSLIKVLYNKADNIISVSNLIKEDLIANYKIKENKIKTIYNPIDFDNLNNKVQSTEETQRISKWKDKSTLFINVGRLEFQKNQIDFIKILSELNKRGSDVKGVILGEGSKRNELENLIIKENMQDRVVLIGHVTNPFSYLKISEIYLLTSYYEGFPNALVEAMALGNYIISSNCKSGPSEILKTTLENEPTDFGLLINDLHTKEINHRVIESIERIVNNPSLRNESIKNSLKRIEDFSFEKIKKEWLSVIESVL